ncbi:MAG TPA: RHS repeat-associated core domain-containing protein [Blastocatellia bacterium]|nr:RHS repeat-associated core domain-containing protein [Blastocatellia bacterium]
MRFISPVRYLFFSGVVAWLLIGGLFRLLPLRPAAAQSCTFTLGSTAQNFAAGGGQGSLRVTASQPACNWTATTNAPWITVTAGASGAGSGSVSYSVALNPTSAPRNGSLTVAGQIFTVNQSANLVGLQFFPLPAPVRLLETRAGFSGCTTPGAAISTNSTFTLPARTACAGVPATAAAVTGNVTVVPSAPGFLTLFPSDAAQPTVANSNFAANEITNNLFTVGLGATGPDAGAFKIFASATTHVIVDVTGYYAPPNVGGLYFHSLPAPVRLLETRAGFSGCFAPGAPLIGTGNPNADPNLDLAVQGRSPIPLPCNSIPASAQMLVGNATSVLPSGGGFLTIYPSGGTRPLIASSNYAGSDVINGPFTVRLGADGKFKIYTLATTHLVVDILGYYSEEAVDANGAGLLFTPLPAPVRLLETRADFPNFPLPGCTRTNAPIQGNLNAATHTQQARSFCGLPASAQAVVGNVTAVNTAGAGFLTLFPGNLTNAPLVATSNYPAPASFGYNRHYFVGLSPGDGTFKVLTQFTTELVVDVSGYFAAAPANQAPLVAAGADQTISLPTLTASLTGAASDDGLPSGALSLNWSRVSGAGTVMFSAPNQAATDATFSGTGVYVLRLTASDGALSASDDVQVTVNPPLSVNAGADQVVTLPNTAMMTGGVTGGSGAATVEWSRLSGPGSVIFSNAGATVTTAMFGINGVYVLRLTATDGQTMVSDDVQVTVNADPTPPPVLNAPPLDMTVATTLATATEFLYSGANAVQTGVAAGTIKPERAAVLRGRVLDKSNQPLPLVKVSVLNHPEYGQTLSRADGRFDLAVNGGGVLTVAYEKIGYLTAQRQENVPWQDYCGVPDVVLIGYDANVTLIDLSANAPVQVARSSINTDTSGARRTALLFKQGTTALMKLPGGTMAGLDKLHVRATEFTVGANGQQAMPGSLPANSGYTYAVDYSIDEAVAAGALETTFSQPVAQYNENFLHFAVGTVIPSGAYDPATGQWVASASGRVVKILSITNGTANLDVNGAGVAATDPEYAALGINTAERQSLATLYAVNQSLWRVPVIHFTKWDSNWPFGPPSGATPPGGPPPECDTCRDQDCPTRAGCVIGLSNQTLGEELDLTGTSFQLRYSSERKTGRTAARSLTLSLSGATIPSTLKRIDLSVAVAGRTFTQSFPAQTNQTTTFTWDGLDAYGRMLQGKQTANIDIGYVYDGVYQQTTSFGYNGNGIPVTGDIARGEITLSQKFVRSIGVFDNRQLALGGWSLNVHHFYDPTDHVLYEGNGARRSVQTINAGITTVAGNGAGGFSGDNGQATNASFFFPFSATTAPNGELYVSDSQNRRVRKVALNGIVTTVAGTGAFCFPNQACGDGGQAVNAQIAFPTDIAFAQDGSYYIFDAQAARVRKVAPSGIITTAVGNGDTCQDPTAGCGDNGPATQAQLSVTGVCCRYNLDVAVDGALYLTDAGNHRVRRVGQDGIISTIAGNGRTAAQGGCTVVGATPVVAANACLEEPLGIAARPDGSVYFTDIVLHQIFRVTADGLIRVVAGDGTCGNTGDGGLATSAKICNPHGLGAGPDGSLYFSDWFNARIRRIDATGIITNYVGTGFVGFSGDGGPAQAAEIRQTIDVSVGSDGAVYLGEANNHRIRKVFAPLPGFNDSDIAVPSQDGRDLFKFNSAGRHLQTINTLTGAVKYTFGYDNAGRLITITDGDNNVTTIQRNGSGAPTGILSPYNQLTTFTLDANGYFAAIANPANEQYQFIYNSGGLMVLKKDPRNNQNTFTYDTQGRLTRDDDAAAGFQTLARTAAGLSFTVTHNSALSRTTTVQGQQTPTDDQQSTVTLPSGLQEILLERRNGLTTQTAPDGTITNTQLGPDPRWQMQAPLAKSESITTPGNLTRNQTFNRVVSLSNPADPLTLVTQNDTTTINGRNYTNNYTAATRTFVFNTPAGRTTTTTNDTQGRPTTQTFANLNAANYGYDARGRLATATFGSGPEARGYSYGYFSSGAANGALASITNPLAQITGFSYDAALRVNQITLPDARVIGLGRDANGNLISVTPPGRPAHTLTYNNVNLLASYTPPAIAGTGPTQFAYNLDKQLTAITRPDALTINYGYDTAGRLSTVTTPSGTYTHTYSATTDNPTGIVAPGGQTLAFTHDGELLTNTTWSGTITGSVGHTYNNFFLPAAQSVNGASTISFTYDNDNLLTGAGALAITRQAQNGLVTGTTLGSVADTRGYNGFGEPVSYTASFNAAPLLAITYTRDKLGRITQKVESVLGGTASTYDYSYDAAGRLTQVKLNAATIATYVYDSNNNRISLTTPGGTVTGAYDNQDRMTAYGAATFTHTANGELLTRTAGAQATSYGYDVLGNLRTVTLPDTTQIEYVYDGLNRRVGKQVGGVLTQGFLYRNLLKPVAELDGGNNLISRFVYGTRSNTPDYVIKGGQTYRIISDHLGSVRLVVNAATGVVAQRMDYDEFGVVILDTSPGFQPFGFAGGLYDPQTKLVRFGARDYDAETGRWTAKDPLLFLAVDTNLYGYASNDPVNLRDATGLFGIVDLVKGVNDVAGLLGLDNEAVAAIAPLVHAKLWSDLEKAREKLRNLQKCKNPDQNEIDKLTNQIANLEQQINQLVDIYNQARSKLINPSNHPILYRATQ